MSRVLPLALAQSLPISLAADPAVFAEQVSALVDDFPNTHLAVFPELHLFGVEGRLAERNEELLAAAEPLEGPRVARLAELAGDLGVWLIPGTVCELGEDGDVYNTAVVLSPQGKLVASYRKCFPWRPYEPTNRATGLWCSTSPTSAGWGCPSATTRGSPRWPATWRGWVPR